MDGNFTGFNTVQLPKQDYPVRLATSRRRTGNLHAAAATGVNYFWRTNMKVNKMTSKLQEAFLFEVLMDAVRVCSLGQITHALFEVGGQYRRSMQGLDI